ncbi:SPOR domain-containing protein [Mucilaginibacter sp. dw_454]|uniref:HU domain-containing protein n=1 Tax=Mucilaginibacter sp. dw_454 TaxID=2720079 RepID=UPI001BD246C1|nr:SPOR domain-containing protein [Mucilaginibacter sp. dw_454]
MDVGFYLGELLMQQGEVSVPGLGYFVQARVSGYYDENERKFYPPYHQAQFDPQSIDDEALSEYIAAKKNISVASARYFAEKYITNLKQQALITEVPLGNLGWFYTELAQLSFRPAAKIIDDSIFYGLEPVKVNKANDVRRFEEQVPKVELNFPGKNIPPKPSVIEEVQDSFVQLPPVTEAPVNVQPAAIYENEPQNQVSPEFFDPGEEEETSSGALRIVLFALIGIMVIGLGVFALYRYQPDTFAKITFWKHKQVITETAKTKPALAAKVVDTLDKDTLRADTPAASKPDTMGQAPTLAKSKVISTAPAEQTVTTTTKTSGKIISATPVDEPAVSKKKTVIISQTPVSANVATNTKKAETVVTKAPTAVTGLPTVIKPKAKPTVEAPFRNDALIANPSDAVGTRRFEVYAVDANSIREANTAIRKMRKYGLDPRIVTDGTGPQIHISIGHFATKEEARDLAFKEIEAGHVPGGAAYGIEIIPQK